MISFKIEHSVAYARSLLHMGWLHKKMMQNAYKHENVGLVIKNIVEEAYSEGYHTALADLDRKVFKVKTEVANRVPDLTTVIEEHNSYDNEEDEDEDE